VPEMSVRTVVERGPKDKKVVAFALDWPGWSRGARTAEEALATLETYRQRYRRVATLARMTKEFDAAGDIEVIEDRVGTGSTDFWGISFSSCLLEQRSMDDQEFTRKVKLLRACWSYFDDVAARVSPEMRKGIRGGGRERDEIIRHTRSTEIELFAKKVGVRVAEGTALSGETLLAYREEYVTALREHHKGARPPMRTWTLPFLIRHSGYHVMDHAWEMEDKDLSGPTASQR
jgi:hypothetical protein